MTTTATTAPIDTQESPLAHLSEEQLEELAREFDAIRDRVTADLGDRDRRYIESMIEMQRRLAVLGRVAAARLPQPAGLGRRDRRPLGGEDPREHGDRPQRPARPVGLDERPRTSTPRPGTGTPPRPPRPGSTPTTTSTTPTPTSAARTRTSATRSCGSTRSRSGTRSTCCSRSTTCCWWPASSGASPSTTSTSRRSARARSPRHQVKRELKGIAGKAKSQIVKDYIAWPLVSALAAAARRRWRWRRGGSAGAPRGILGRRRGASGSAAGRRSAAPLRERRARPSARPPRPTPPPTSSATSGPTRSSSAATSPTRPTPSAQEEVEDESRGGWYVRQLVGAANIEGSPLFHVASGNLGYQVEHHLFPDMPSTRYAEIAPQVKDICERYGLPYNSGPFLPAAGDGPADDPAPRLPRRQAAAEAGALPRGERTRG